MPRQQVLSFPRVPTSQERMLDIINKSHHSIQTFDPRTRSLKTFPWYILDSLTFTRSIYYSLLHRPMKDSVRVSPDKWRDYRENHDFLNPSCLCALFQPQGEVLRYNEAAIYLPLNGQYRGEWVAECAKGCCGYLGKSLFPPKIGCTTYHVTKYIWRGSTRGLGSQSSITQ
jgi:hypothetical protein